jgi:hypothetical protein
MALTQESLWVQTLDKEPPLPSNGDVLASFQSFTICMDDLDEAYPSRAIGSHMRKLEQYFAILNGITAAIKVLTPKSSAAVSQIWRTTQAMMTVT